MVGRTSGFSTQRRIPSRLLGHLFEFAEAGVVSSEFLGLGMPRAGSRIELYDLDISKRRLDQTVRISAGRFRLQHGGDPADFLITTIWIGVRCN